MAMLGPVAWLVPPDGYGPWEQVVSNLTVLAYSIAYLQGVLFIGFLNILTCFEFRYSDFGF